MLPVLLHFCPCLVYPSKHQGVVDLLTQFQTLNLHLVWYGTIANTCTLKVVFLCLLCGAKHPNIFRSCVIEQAYCTPDFVPKLINTHQNYQFFSLDSIRARLSRSCDPILFIHQR